MILPTGNLCLLSRSQMCTFDITQQMIKIKSKEFTCEKKSKCLFLSIKMNHFDFFKIQIHGVRQIRILFFMII